MKHRTVKGLYGIAILLAAFGIHAAECDDPKTSADVMRCLGVELRASDARINVSYTELMGKLGSADKTKLRSEQRAWIRERDSKCKLDSKESNRERWYQALLNDYVMTVCVTRYTRQRTAELDRMLSDLSPRPLETVARPKPAPAPAAAPATGPDIAYDKRPATVHSKGKWYFEIAVNYGEIVRIEPVLLAFGVSDKSSLTGTMDNVRSRDAGKGAMRYGIAVDLDNGKLYISRNGEWGEGEPGSNRGQDLKLGRNYNAAILFSADNHTQYLERNAVIPNFGDRAMAYSLPPGYRPWRSQTLN